MQIVFTIIFFGHGLGWGAHMTGTDIERLYPVVGAIFLDHEQPLQAHHDMHMRLDVAVIERRTRLAGLQLIGAGAAGHDR